MATFTLTSGPDTFSGTPQDDTVNGTAATLNAGDSLTGGAGTDVLALFGSGTFRVDQLAVFTGFETIAVSNFTGGVATVYIGSQPIKMTGDGSNSILFYSSSPANWNAANVIDGISKPNLGLLLNTDRAANAFYDLTPTAFTHLYGLEAYGDNTTVKINNANAAGIFIFDGTGQNIQLVTSDATLDLSHSSVTGFTVVSSNATGTTFAVQDLSTAFQIAGGTGQDTIRSQTFVFSDAQRDAIFASASVETIIDPSGTYTAGPPSPNTFELTTAADTFNGTSAAETVSGTAATLNAGDSLTGGAGNDVLLLYGSGTFRVDQLAAFSGFETITLNNYTSGVATAYLGNQPVKMTGGGSNSEFFYSLSAANWNAANVIDGTLAPHLGLSLNRGFTANALYDLTPNTFINLKYLDAFGNNLTVKISNTNALGISGFSGTGQNMQLVTSDATLDLSHSSVTGFTIASSNATGTTFLVQDLGTALQIAGGAGHDTIKSQKLVFSAAQRDAIFASASVEKIIDPSGTYVHEPTNDFNGDGNGDILWRHASGQVVEWQMNGAQIAADLNVAAPGNEWKFQDTGDFGNDGFSDVMWRHTTGQVVLWQMNGNRIVSNTSILEVSNQYHVQGVADFNGDGKSDVLFRHDSGQVVLWQMDGDRIAVNTAIATPSREYHIEGVGDFGGDGKSDVLFRNDDGQVVLWQMNGDKIASNTLVANVSRDYHVQGIGDFNGDGKSDVVWRHVSGQFVLWQMDGDRIVSNTQILDVSNQYKIQDVRDYNGDGMSDILLRHDSGQVVMWQMNGDRIASNTAVATLGNDWTIQAHHFDLL